MILILIKSRVSIRNFNASVYIRKHFKRFSINNKCFHKLDLNEVLVVCVNVIDSPETVVPQNVKMELKYFKI